MAAAASASTLVRGPLKFEVATSSPQLEAGKPFSMYVKITNPYNVPAIINRIRSRLPIEFRAAQRSDSTSTAVSQYVFEKSFPLQSAQIGQDVQVSAPSEPSSSAIEEITLQP